MKIPRCQDFFEKAKTWEKNPEILGKSQDLGKKVKEWSQCTKNPKGKKIKC